MGVQATKGRGRRNAAGPAPVAELSDVHPAVAGLAIVDPGLWAFERRAESPLGETRLLAQPAEESRDAGIVGMMLRFGGHGLAGSS
jgi:hypothetical protein